MSNQGVWFGAMCLDPVRDYVVGPKWWHRWSVKNGYSFLSDAFVHHPIELETFSSRSIEPTVVPHGEYPMPPPSCSSAELKRELGIPDSDNVALCYGHLRDNKNLKTSIEAVAATPGYSLVVAGSEAAPGQIQSSDYVRFAKEIDAESSVFWKIGYQTDQDTSNLFQMSDCILLPYDSSFVSASGVLFIAVPFEVPLIASCGDGPLAAAVQDYGLGIRIPKPTITQVSQALKSVDEVAESARWNDFRHEHSYDRNAELLLDRIAVFHNLQNQE
ncbi:glycosyltransferase [Rhodopirellula bahusiensis]|uniref:Glycosyl transferase family 1 domain-containing protein n=1 Tax=Rhodopirellula bahusiensis TaxID=2014065 RepID=A0A2G1WCI2_9BACT|nr:glycosyltransferase [Rhodopirellula bahusiensis]PHQ36743.1 hypothetical protein CEE69_05230 [Rhodopirellula bahusiensis]